MCLYSRLIQNPKYKANKKNRGNIPPIPLNANGKPDHRVKWVPIGCGDCIECRKQKARGWRLRLLEDIKHNKNGKFITFTFSNESIKHLICELDNKELKGYALDNAIATLATRRFLERWRKKYGKSLRHWMITELGQRNTENIHLHGIIWTDLDKETVSKIWSYGYIYLGNNKRHWVNDQTVNYITKYVTKKDEKHKTYKSIILTSPGIGSKYTETPNAKTNKFNGTNTIDTYRTRTGHKIAMPIYWRNKLYTERQREQLWTNRLDKNERWICGEMVKADDIQTIDKLTRYYRQINTRLGYGNGDKSWDQIQYENARRELLQQRRVSASGPE